MGFPCFQFSSNSWTHGFSAPTAKDRQGVIPAARAEQEWRRQGVLFFSSSHAAGIAHAQQLGRSQSGSQDFAKVSINPRLARAAAITSACLAFGLACVSGAASSARTIELCVAYTGRSRVTVIVSIVPSLHDSTELVGRKGTAIRRRMVALVSPRLEFSANVARGHHPRAPSAPFASTHH
jgi:hypothetical protein